MWKEKIEAHLQILGLSEALKSMELPEDKDPDEEETSEKIEKREALKEKIQKARGTIVLSVTNRVLRKVIKEKTIAAMLKALDNQYMSKALPNRIYLKQKLYGYKMSEGQSMESNLDEFVRIIADLENTNVTVTDEDQAILLLMSLPRTYDQLRDTLKYGTGRTTLTFDEVVAAIHYKELELNAVKKGQKNQAEGLYVKEKAEQRGRLEQRKKGQRNDRSRSKSKSRRGCWTCGEEGHFKASCPNKNKQQGKQNQGNNKAESSNGKGLAVEASSYVSEALSTTGVSLEDEWIMDSGCSYHMTHKREWFEDMAKIDGGTVRMGNKTLSKVKGIGSIRIKNENDMDFVLTDVRYIPEMDRNLLSLGTFEKAGYSFESKDGILSIKTD